MKDVVVIGAGLTGLATGLNLVEQGKDIILLEKSNRVGGVMHSIEENGFVVEEGPNSGVLGNIEVIRLFEKLEGLCQLEIANPKAKKRYILKNSRWEPIPSGLISGITTPLFTASDKFKLLGEPFRPRGKNPHETLADFVIRRLGKSFLDYAVDPFISGVYAGDTQTIIPKYALPKLYNLEQDYGSFIGGAMKKGFKHKTEDEKKVTRAVFSVKGGYSNLTNALYNKIGKENFFMGVSQIEVNLSPKGYEVSFVDTTGNTTKLSTKNVITTINPHSFSTVFPFIEKSMIETITKLRYAPVVEVAIGFEKWKGMSLDAFGGLIPSKENRKILGVLFMSTLFDNRAPKEGALLTVFMGGIKKQEYIKFTDDEIKSIVKDELVALMEINDFNPDLFKIFRYPFAIPQYEISSKERFEVVSELEIKYPGLVFGGNLKDGIGMADRILQAKKMVSKTVD